MLFYKVILALSLGVLMCFGQDTRDPVPVTIDNFIQAESHTYFAKFVDTLGKFFHIRNLAPVDDQLVIRYNRDTLYSGGIFDFHASPVTLTIPNIKHRYYSVSLIDENHYTKEIFHKAGVYRIDKKLLGDSRYGFMIIRIFVDPLKEDDIKEVNAIQDSFIAKQSSVGSFEVPHWDKKALGKLRTALLLLEHANGGLESTKMFGSKDLVDPVHHLIGTATVWGGLPSSEAVYSSKIVDKNDGKTKYYLNVPEKVPVDGFWSVTVYDKDGHLVKNDLDMYNINNLTAVKKDNKIIIQFGGCDEIDSGSNPSESSTTTTTTTTTTAATETTPLQEAGASASKPVNCLPIIDGWSYVVRLYKPRDEVVKGEWKFPEATLEPV